MVFLTLHKNADDSFALFLTDFPEYLFNGFCPGAIEYVEYGPLDDILGAAERLMVPDDTYRLFVLSCSGENRYGMEVIRGAERNKDEATICKGPLKILHDVIRRNSAPRNDSE